MIETSIRNIHFECANCDQKGEAVEIIYTGGINDTGGFVLKCKECLQESFLSCKNPSDGFESRILSDNFELIRILDFDFEDDKSEFETIYSTKLVKNVLQISQQAEMPLLKNAWKIKPEYRIDLSDKIYTCSSCKKNIENEIYRDISLKIKNINVEYHGWLNWQIKGNCDPELLVFNSISKCDNCNSNIDYSAFAKFTGSTKDYNESDLIIADLKIFEPNVNGVYSREQSKRFLEKFILRWNLIASKIIVVSPFLGFDKNIAIKTPYKFLSLLEWFLTLNSFDKTQVLIRKSEYTKIKEVIGIDIFEQLNQYGLLNNLIEEMNSSTTRFHAKFYAGIIPNGDDPYVEILTGSYNLHEESSSKENLIYIKMGLNDFEENYLKPLKINSLLSSYDKNLEVLKINDDKSKIINPQTKFDLTSYNID
jgi:hypothetical protein